jgi:dienelactone hydrolase
LHSNWHWTWRQIEAMLSVQNTSAEEMTKAQADWQIIRYGGTVHSFTNPDADRVGVPRIAYNVLADERSWKAMVAFFEEIFDRA